MTTAKARLLLLATTAAILPAAIPPVAAMAQEGPGDPVVLDTIVLSAGLTPLAADSYARAHTVLTGDEIEARGIVTVQEALRGLPGVNVVSTGETLTKIRIRGGESNHVLVLIDGVEVNAAGSGDYIFSGMMADDIERIEVLRGPQSAIHGANAASGVISITTRRAEGPGLSYGGGVEVGSHGSRAANAYVRAGNDRGGIGFTAAIRRTDGEDASRTPGGDTEFNDRKMLGLNGSYDLTDSVSLGFTLRRIWQEYGYDDLIPWGTKVSDPADYVVDAPLTADRDEVYGSVWIEAGAMGGALLNRLALTGMNQDTAHFYDGVPDYDDASRRRHIRYTGTWAIDGSDARDAAQKLNFAVGKQRETYRSSFAPGGRFERDMTSLAVEYQGRFDNGASLQASVRRDLNDSFRDATSWSIAGAWQVPGRDLRLRASAGRATVNPDMFQQFGWSGTYRGNPDLKPETTQGYEVGADLGFAGGRGQAGLTIFTGKIEDMIAGAGDTSVNVEGSSTRKGAELALTYEASDWLRLGASYTYIHARTEAGTPVVRQPRHQLGLSATGAFAEGRGAVGVDALWVAGAYDEEWFRSDTPDTTELPAYTVVNLAAHYDLTPAVRLSGRVVNLFDEDYFEAWGYYGRGRAAHVGLQARW